MPAPATVNEFLDLVRKSGVLDDKRLEAYAQKLQTANSMPADPAKVAGVMVRDGLLTTFQGEQILQGKWRRFTIGKYRVLERIGSGGMGSVYLCEHKVMRRRVAVKVLPTAKASDPSSLERFYREARAVAALDHANIVHAYDIDQDENLHFLVMEYVDGASLQEMVKRTGPMDPLRVAHYMRQAALGLGHAFERGLIHRDIKPGNLLVDRLGTLKVLDMGLARFFNDEEDILTKKYDESVLGTADYLAPEQAVDSHDVDVRADIYSLGATFYFVLTGKTPFGDGTVAQKLIWHQSRQPKPLSAVRADVPAGLAAIIQKMMAKEPDQRYQTPQEVADALTPWTEKPIPPPPEAEMPRLSPALSGSGEAATIVASGSPGGPKSGLKGWQVTTAPAAKPSSSPKAGQPTEARVQTSPPVRASAGGMGDGMPTRVTGKPNGQKPANALLPRPAMTETVPWEAMGNDTQALVSQTDTTPRPDAKPRSSRRLGVPAQPDQRRVWLVVGAVSAVFLLIVVFCVWRFILSRPAPPVQVRAALLVTQDPKGQHNSFRTIKQALSKAEPGDRIVLLDDHHQENVVVRPQFGTTRVTIEAAEGKHVLWTAENPKDPLLTLADAKDFQLNGKGIALDGKGRLKTLVTLNLHCPGLQLENAILKGFTNTAITVTNCAGDPDNPVRLTGLRIAATTKGAAAALAFDANPSIVACPVNDNVVVSDSCRFEGFVNNPIQVKPHANGANVKVPTPIQ